MSLPSLPAPYRRWPRTAAGAGFTLIELLVVIGIIAILALIALPGVSDKLIRERIVESIRLANIVKTPVEASWALNRGMPIDNAAAGLPVADKIVNDYISSVALESGAIQITFGNHANPVIRGKVLTLRPGVIEDAIVVPITWVCGDASPPDRMVAKGLNKTDVPARYLPLTCRATGRSPSPA